MKIRELTEADIPELREIAIRIASDTFGHLNAPENMEAFLEKDYSTDSFIKEFREPGSRYFFISDDDRTAGYLRLRKSTEVNHILGTNTIELHRIYVDHSYHGKKVGDQLIQFAIDVAKENKHDWIWLGVWEGNPRAQRFYEKWGFEKFSEHDFFMGDDRQTDWLLRKKI
ncbi:MAG TPA: GNAT family N-acetyltransferase [Cyclobacteriaceae bacterium]|nr:GNAT family N-acetyltransferase [Cyclobacteriaceae bacterium]